MMKKAKDGSMVDPDARFILANERTLLAWVRTSLALVGGGLVLTQIGNRDTSQIIIGICAIFYGAIMALVGYARYLAADEAIHQDRAPSTGRGPGFQVVMVVSFAFILAVIELIHILSE